jgi:hypothetical protein
MGPLRQVISITKGAQQLPKAGNRRQRMRIQKTKGKGTGDEDDV